MNRLFLVVALVVAVPGILLLGMGLMQPRTPPPAPVVGRPAPPFALEPFAAAPGTPPIRLGALKGKPIVLNFWATWCVPCQAEHPVLQRAAAVLGSRVQFLGVAFDDDPGKIGEYLRQNGSQFPVLLDPGARTAIDYGVSGVPETFFIDAEGMIISKFSGALDAETLVNRTAQLFSGAGGPRS